MKYMVVYRGDGVLVSRAYFDSLVDAEVFYKDCKAHERNPGLYSSTWEHKLGSKLRPQSETLEP